MYDGKTNQQMADELFVSVNTIKTHISNIYIKLDVANRTAAIAKVRGWQ
jgi:ATP/maltotriose-dependent transcriptional regulator MalT